MKTFRQIFSVTGAVLLVLLAACTPKETKLLLEPSQALGTVLAEETVRIAGAKKQVVLIVPHWAPASAVGESFKAALKKQGVAIAFTQSADMGDPMGHNPIGLKSTDFFAALDKGAGAGVIVSLAGAPFLSTQDAARLSSGHPPVLVVATASLGEVMGLPGDRSYLASLLEAKMIQMAIVDGESEPAAQPSGKMNFTQQSFFQHYRILRNPN